MKSRRLLYIILLFVGLYYLSDALKILFVDFERINFEVFGKDIGRLPYVIYELFIATSLIYLGFQQLQLSNKKKD